MRLGGVDKASLEIDGVSLLESSIAATKSAADVVVVGVEVPTTRTVTWCREEPAGGGPAAGLLAGIDALSVEPPDLVCVLAVDMPGVRSSTFDRLVAALSQRGDADAAVLLDVTGRQQMLAGVYRYPALAAARPSDRGREHGLAMRELIGPLRVIGIPAIAAEAQDVDTWEDVTAFRRRP